MLELQTVENEKLLRLLEIEAERTRVHDAVFGVTLLVLVGAWLCSQPTEGAPSDERGGTTAQHAVASEAPGKGGVRGGGAAPAAAEEPDLDEWRWRDTARWKAMIPAEPRPDDNLAQAWFGTTAVGYVDVSPPPVGSIGRDRRYV